MNFEEAIKEIVKDWEVLHKAQNTGYSIPKSVAVWCAKSDTAGAYEVDEEWVGISPQGNIVWAYASGCSCWDGDYTEDTKPTLKEMELVHKQHTPEDWQAMIIKFAETKKMQEF